MGYEKILKKISKSVKKGLDKLKKELKKNPILEEEFEKIKDSLETNRTEISFTIAYYSHFLDHAKEMRKKELNKYK